MSSTDRRPGFGTVTSHGRDKRARTVRARLTVDTDGAVQRAALQPMTVAEAPLRDGVVLGGEHLIGMRLTLHGVRGDGEVPIYGFWRPDGGQERA